MNPQSWLAAFVQRNVEDLARMRGYVELSLANAMKAERDKRPRPEMTRGEVLAMEVRDRVLLSADNPVFASGKFAFRKRPLRAVRLVERATGVELPLRKISGPVSVERSPAARTPPVYVQEILSDPAVDMLAEGLVAALVWSIDQHDLMADFRAVIVDGPESLNRSPLVAVASVEIPPLESLLAAGSVVSSGPVLGDDFDQLVARRKPRAKNAGGTGDAPSGA